MTIRPPRRTLIAVLALVSVLAACQTNDSADEAGFTVGLINPLTGPFAALGEDVNDGFRLFVEENDGQLGGIPVTLNVEDEANDTAIATEAAERLISQGADVLVGFVNSGVTYGASQAIVESGVPLIITTAGADDLTQRDANDTVFRVSYTSSQDSMPLGDYACDTLGYDTVTLVALDYAFGWEAAAGFAKTFTDSGCTIGQELYVPLGTQDWAPFVQQIDRDADAVWAVIAGPDTIRFLEAYTDFGIDLPIIGHGALTDEQVLSEQRERAKGIVTSLHYSAAIDTDANTAFKEAFEARYERSVSQYADNGYIAAKAIDAALTAADTTEREAFITALRGIEVDGPRGPTRFDEYGQAIYNVYIRRVDEIGGTYQNTVIDTRTDVSQFYTYTPEQFMSGPGLSETRNTWAN
ncbi:MAG: ABC transporter substrate-binding protein [Nitriliruptoraceae bacterium]